MDIRFNEGDGRIACGITEILTEIALEWLAENKNAKLFHVAVACIGMAEGFSKPEAHPAAPAKRRAARVKRSVKTIHRML